MSGAKSRNKGTRGEREFLTLVNNEMGTDLKRNLSQYQESAGDVPDLGGFTVEVKRQAKFSPSWWKEAVAHAEAAGRMPALAYRCDFVRAWSVVLYAKDCIAEITDGEATVTLDLDTFFELVRIRSDNPLQRLAELTAKHREVQT